MRACAFVCFLAVSGCVGADPDRLNQLETRISELQSELAQFQKSDTPTGIDGPENPDPPPPSKVFENITAKQLTLIGHKGQPRVHFDGNVLRVRGLVAQSIYTSDDATNMDVNQPHDTAGVFMTGSEGGATLMLTDGNNGQIGVSLETRPFGNRVTVHQQNGEKSVALEAKNGETPALRPATD